MATSGTYATILNEIIKRAGSASASKTAASSTNKIANTAKKYISNKGGNSSGTSATSDEPTIDPAVQAAQTSGATFNTVDEIKQYQLSRGIEATGEWNDATRQAYLKDMIAEGTYGDVTELSDIILKTYNLPTTDMDEIRGQVESYLRNSYDQSIADRQEATDEQRAMIDLDAYSRGMGGSTWVTDAKQRVEDSEMSDIADMEASYQAGLTEAVLNQYNSAVAQGLAAQDNAYTLALELYSLGQQAKENSGGNSVSGGRGSSYYSGSRKTSSSGSSFDNSGFYPAMEDVHSKITSSYSKTASGRNSAAQDLVGAQVYLGAKAAAAGDAAAAQYYSHWRPARPADESNSAVKSSTSNSTSTQWRNR